jgi:hypothetical protein
MPKGLTIVQGRRLRARAPYKIVGLVTIVRGEQLHH